MWPNSQDTEDLITFTEEILNGKLIFLCAELEKEKEVVKNNRHSRISIFN